MVGERRAKGPVVDGGLPVLAQLKVGIDGEGAERGAGGIGERLDDREGVTVGTGGFLYTNPGTEIRHVVGTGDGIPALRGRKPGDDGSVRSESFREGPSRASQDH